MAKLYDVAVKTGSYTDKSGATKGRYENIGVMMEGDNGPYLMLKRTFNPAGVPGNADRDNIICSLFKPSDDQSARPAARAPLNVADDEIPF
jgi:hypothetical protein